MAKVTINGEVVKVKSGTTILNAVNSIGIEIPTLCFIKEINEIGFCRICVVEVEGEQDLISACNTEIKNGMVISTESDKVIDSRRATLQLLASKHRFDCWKCPKDGHCDFYDLLKEFDVTFEEFGPGNGRNSEQIYGTGVSQDQTKCVLCKKCVAVCASVAAAKVIKFRDEVGINPTVSPTPGLAFDESGCTFCGLCVEACPTGTLFETNGVTELEGLLRNRNIDIIAQITKEANQALLQEFGVEEESYSKSISALEKLGIKTVVSTDFGTDMNAYATAKEVEKRLENAENFPVITSQSATVNRYLELYKSELLDNLSPVQTPMTLQGTLLKQKLVNKDVKVVSIETTPVSKYELTREELATDGVKAVDVAVTVNELAKLLKRRNINLNSFEEQEYNTELTGELIPPVNGGTLISVLNTLSVLQDSKELAPIKFKQTRGEKEFNNAVGSILEATVQINGKKIKVAQVNGAPAFKEMFEKLQSKKPYHIVELSMDAPKEYPELPYSNPTHNKLVTDMYSDVKELIHTTYSKKEFTKE